MAYRDFGNATGRPTHGFAARSEYLQLVNGSGIPAPDFHRRDVHDNVQGNLSMPPLSSDFQVGNYWDYTNGGWMPQHDVLSYDLSRNISRYVAFPSNDVNSRLDSRFRPNRAVTRNDRIVDTSGFGYNLNLHTTTPSTDPVDLMEIGVWNSRPNDRRPTRGRGAQRRPRRNHGPSNSTIAVQCRPRHPASTGGPRLGTPNSSPPELVAASPPGCSAPPDQYFDNGHYGRDQFHQVNHNQIWQPPRYDQSHVRMHSGQGKTRQTMWHRRPQISNGVLHYRPDGAAIHDSNRFQNTIHRPLVAQHTPRPSTLERQFSEAVEMRETARQHQKSDDSTADGAAIAELQVQTDAENIPDDEAACQRPQ